MVRRIRSVSKSTQHQKPSRHIYIYICIYLLHFLDTVISRKEIRHNRIFQNRCRIRHRKDEENQEGLELERTLQYLIYADGVTLLGKNRNFIYYMLAVMLQST